MVTERYVRAADGTELFTSSVGQGLPLLLCDGLGCDGFVWEYLVPAFAPHHRLIRWHYRGHGLSQAPRDRDYLGVDALCSDALAVLDAWDVDHCVLLGHSMGVQVILDLALRAPERVVGLVPMCGSYGHPLETFHDTDFATVAFPRIFELVRRFPTRAQRLWSRLLSTELAFQIGVNFELNAKLIRRPDFERYLRHLSSMDIGVFVAILERLSEHTVEDRLPDLRVPTLIVAGEKDTFTPAWLSQRMQQLIPDAELLLIRSGTHAAPVELPELVHLRLERFLAERVLASLDEKVPRAAAKARRPARRPSRDRPRRASRDRASGAAREDVAPGTVEG